MDPLLPADDPDADLAAALRASAGMVDAPEPLILSVLAAFESRRPAPKPRRVFAAVLAFDSGRLDALAFGRRGAGTAIRQLLYSHEGMDVDLRVAELPDGVFSITGQLLGPDGHAQVRLDTDPVGTETVCAATDELGEFRLMPVPPGDYRLQLDCADVTLVLPPLHLPIGP